MHIKLKRTPGLFLTGFMGAGKTTAGKLLADKLGWDFVDLDNEVERWESAPVREIFANHGEEVFRRMETAALQQLIAKIERGHPTVVALGGGTFPRPENFELLSHAGISVFLHCSFATAMSRVPPDGERPLAMDPARFRELFEHRQRDYARADYRVDAEGDPASVVSAILGLPLWT